MAQHQQARSSEIVPAPARVLQRACACGQHTHGEGECAHCRKQRETTLQRAVHSSDPVTAVPPVVHDVLRSPGRPLDAGTRSFMEPRFGHDFSTVRVHSDDQAARSARSVGALAYTVGRDVVFGAGQYRPQTGAGRSLIAHELAHVVQQRNAIPEAGGLRVAPPGTAPEREAEAAASVVGAGTDAVRVPSAGRIPPAVQRQDGTVTFDLQVPTPEESERLRQQGISLPQASEQSADPRRHSDYVDRRITAVGFGIYLGGYHLYVQGLDLPVFVPEDYVAHGITNVSNVDSVIYPSREQAWAATPAGPPMPGQGFPMAYYRGAGNLVVPAFFSPATTPVVYETMMAARRELGRQVSNELTVVALMIAGGFVVRGIGSVIRRVAGRGTPAPPPPPPGPAGPPNLRSIRGGGQTTPPRTGHLRDVSAPETPPPTRTPAAQPRPPQVVEEPLAATGTTDAVPLRAPRSGPEGVTRNEPTVGMAGRRRGTEHTSGARPSTAETHEIGQSRRQAQESAADERGAGAVRRGFLRQQRQTLSEIESRIRNMPDNARRQLLNRQTPEDVRVGIIRQYLSESRSYDLNAALREVELTLDDLIAHLTQVGLFG